MGLTLLLADFLCCVGLLSSAPTAVPPPSGESWDGGSGGGLSFYFLRHIPTSTLGLCQVVILSNWNRLEDISGHVGVGDLLPRMTEWKHEEVQGGMEFFQRGVLKPEV